MTCKLRSLIGIALCVVCLSTPATAQPQGTRVQAVPLSPLAHLSTAQILINGHGPYTFVVDTGASVNVLNEELAAKLMLPVTGSTEIGSPMATELPEVDTLNIAALKIGDVVIKDAAAVAMNLEEMFGSMPTPDGILAAGAIEGHIMTINFPAGYLMLRQGELPPADGQKILTYDATDTVPILNITVAGKSIAAALDCGAPSGLTLPASYIEKLPMAAAPQKTGMGRTVDAEFEIKTGSLAGNINIGDITIVNPTLAFIEQTPHANIGMRILSQYAISIDRSNQRISFEKQENTAPANQGQRRMVHQGGPRKSYGIQLRGISGDVISVIGANPDSPAGQAGLQAGDDITGMNGKALTTLDKDSRVKALRGSPLVLTIERDGKKMELTLTMED
jgi:predicted aspartyl protease